MESVGHFSSFRWVLVESFKEALKRYEHNPADIAFGQGSAFQLAGSRGCGAAAALGLDGGRRGFAGVVGGPGC